MEEVTFEQKHEGSEGMQVSEPQAEGGASAEPDTGSRPGVSEEGRRTA